MAAYIKETLKKTEWELHSAHTVYLMVLTINSDCFPKQH
jgi:hypothetical protein